MKKGSIMITVGCIVVFLYLFPVLYGELLPNLFGMLAGLLLIIVGVFTNKCYHDKNYFMAIFSVIALWGLMLLYIFLFRTQEYLGYKYTFYILIGLFILLIIFSGRFYIRKHKKGDL